MTIRIYDVSIGDLLAKSGGVEFDAVEKAASLVFSRAARFMDGYCVATHLTNVCTPFFGDTNVLQREGLVAQYRKMKQNVEQDNLIGLILLGVNTKDILIDYYPTVQDNVIALTVDSICKVLIREHFTKSEVDTICRRTDGFDTYYPAVSSGK
jgi:hypothetical protein